MFADAIETAGGFTRPLVVSTRTADAVVRCSIGTYVVLNSGGWVLTAAHMMDAVLVFDIGNDAEERRTIPTLDALIAKLLFQNACVLQNLFRVGAHGGHAGTAPPPARWR